MADSILIKKSIYFILRRKCTTYSHIYFFNTICLTFNFAFILLIRISLGGWSDKYFVCYYALIVLSAKENYFFTTFLYDISTYDSTFHLGPSLQTNTKILSVFEVEEDKHTN